MLMRDFNHKVFKKVFAEIESGQRSELISIREGLVGQLILILILLLAIFLRSSV